MTKRRHLTPPQGVPAPGGNHAMRRGGARRDISERVFLKREGGETHEGWALNVSRGGVRAIYEEKIPLGADFDVTVGEEAGLTRRGRIVWVQEEPDGVIIGIEFIGASQTFRSAPPPPADAQVLQRDSASVSDGDAERDAPGEDSRVQSIVGEHDQEHAHPPEHAAPSATSSSPPSPLPQGKKEG